MGSKPKVRYAGKVTVAKPGEKKPSKLAAEGLKLFDRGVQAQLGRLSKRRIVTVAIVGGETVRAVPRRVGGRYVVRPANSQVKKAARPAAS